MEHQKASPMQKLFAAVRLSVRFGVAVLLSGLQTVRLIVQHGLRRSAPPVPGFVRIGFPPLSARGAALLGALVTLTPGTTVVRIDMAAREMVLHLLDVTQAQHALAGIRRDFEPGLVRLFGTVR